MAITFRFGTVFWLRTINSYEWLLIATVATYGMLAVVLRREEARKKQAIDDLQLAPPFVRFWQKFRQDLATIDDMNFDDVLWTISVPLGQDEDGKPHAASQSPELTVRLPPRCPKCGFNLRESRFESAYRWQCTACPFHRLSRQVFETVSARMRRIARQAWTVSDDSRGLPQHSVGSRWLSTRS